VKAAPSGQQYELVEGEQRVVIVEVGGGVRSYRAGARNIVDGYDRDEMCTGGRGQLLIPWPNRIAEGRYAFGGRQMQLAVNEVRTGSAIHGLTRWTAWNLVDAGRDRITLTLDLPAQDGYPFMLGLTVAYRLDANGLTVRTTAVNRGDAPCPYGAGAHPYVQLHDDVPIDECTLQVPADATLQTDEHGIPTGRERSVEGTDHDFRVPRRIGSIVLDTAFTQLTPDRDGVTRVSLATANRDRGVVVWMDSAHPFAMIYSGDTLTDVRRRRRGLAIEPMTCAPDAFNSGKGLVALQPGESHTSTWGITPGGDPFPSPV
jgi:aldose 1-epimerase